MARRRRNTGKDGGTTRGQLIAVEGTLGRDVREAAAEVWRALHRAGAQGGVSAWDASGTFSEARLAPKQVFRPSPRTLMLLFAADLQFRLRWQIRPALAQGHVVVAAPYVSTGIAYGAATGLPKRWLKTLFEDAPPADTILLVDERKPGKGWKPKGRRGFGEALAEAIENAETGRDVGELRSRVIAVLESLDGRNHVARLRAKTLRKLAEHASAHRSAHA